MYENMSGMYLAVIISMQVLRVETGVFLDACQVCV